MLVMMWRWKTLKLLIERHSADNIEVDVEQFDAIAMNQQLNDNNVMTVELGGNIISRIDVKAIIPVEETNEVINTESESL